MQQALSFCISRVSLVFWVLRKPFITFLAYYSAKEEAPDSFEVTVWVLEVILFVATGPFILRAQEEVLILLLSSYNISFSLLLLHRLNMVESLLYPAIEYV